MMDGFSRFVHQWLRHRSRLGAALPSSFTAVDPILEDQRKTGKGSPGSPFIGWSWCEFIPRAGDPPFSEFVEVFFAAPSNDPKQPRSARSNSRCQQYDDLQKRGHEASRREPPSVGACVCGTSVACSQKALSTSLTIFEVAVGFFTSWHSQPSTSSKTNKVGLYCDHSCHNTRSRQKLDADGTPHPVPPNTSRPNLWGLWTQQKPFDGLI